MASKKTGNVRMQPIRATQPFQLRQGSPARKSPSSSPTPRATGDARVPVRSRWSEHRTSPDRSDRKSPNSLKVSSRRSQSPCIRRTSSLDTIAVPYLTGQWPRDAGVQYQYTVAHKSTQTPDWSSEAANQQQTMQIITSSGKGVRQGSIAEQDLVPQMRKQLRNNAKRSNDKKERSPPVHGNHSALYQLSAPLPKSNPISISTQAFGRIPRRQNSIEALNKEIDMLFTSIGGTAQPFEPKYIQGLTPPDGHRAPGPRTSSTRTMETQTPQDNFGLEFSREENEGQSDSVVVHSPPSSPTEQLQQHSTNLLRSSTENETKEAGISPCPKYASSPRPNNSYKFKREPPEGAENVRPFKEQDAQLPVFPSCPDTKKINFFKSTSSAFSPLPVKLIEAFSAAALGPDQNVGNLHAPMTNNTIAVNVNNNNNTSIEGNNNRSPLSTLHSTVEI